MATKKKQVRRKATSSAKKPTTTKSKAAKKTSTQAKSSRAKPKSTRKVTVAQAKPTKTRVAKGATTKAVKAKPKTAAKKAAPLKTLQLTLDMRSDVEPAGKTPRQKKRTSKGTKTLASAAKLTKKFTVAVKKKPKTKPVNQISTKPSRANQSQHEAATSLPVETFSSEQRAKEIGKRAYCQWEAAGCPDGDGVDFWLAAEGEFDRVQPQRS